MSGHKVFKNKVKIDQIISEHIGIQRLRNVTKIDTIKDKSGLQPDIKVREIKSRKLNNTLKGSKITNKKGTQIRQIIAQNIGKTNTKKFLKKDYETKNIYFKVKE